MTDAARTDFFLDSMDAGNSAFLESLYEEAQRTGVPVIKRETQRLLRVLLNMKKPAAVLEIGTAIGFSALLICENSGAHVTTIESWEKRIPLAEANFARAGMSDRVTLLKGDASEILSGLSGQFDFIFLDAAKGQYIHFLPDLLRLLGPEGVLVSDNCLQEGRLIESRYAIDRRERTIHRRMREYLMAISRDPALETVILPVGDGVAVSVKKS